MATMEALRRSAIQHLEQAAAAIEPLENLDGYSRRSVLSTITSTVAGLQAINIPAYRALTKAGGSTAVFDRALADARSRTGDRTSNLSIPYDLGRLLAQAAKSPDVATTDAIALAIAHARRAYRDVRLMGSSTLRLLQSNWLIVAILAIAIVYAIVYFIFFGSHVEQPLTGDGPREVASKAKDALEQMQSTIKNADGVVDAANGFVSKLTDFISKIPQLLAALGGVWLVVRKAIAG
jgi:hypothetical protein